VFAVTGHSAQGKTLPKVLINLHEGGFAAYVAASHTQTRNGLCITRLVTLDQLNKSLPSDLLQEVWRFDVIEHNTYIKHGFHAGTIIDVPDSEAEYSTMKHKHDFSEIDGSQPVLNNSNKHFKACLPGRGLQPFYHPERISAGCTWSQEDWSCSYDSVFMILFHAHCCGSAAWKSLWIFSEDRLCVSLSQSFCVLES
jgi:hypothetical protein